jgi:tetratricopeptide (TPR) repeat protein
MVKKVFNLVFNSIIAWLYFSLAFVCSILYYKEIPHSTKLLFEYSGLLFFIIVFIKDRTSRKVSGRNLNKGIFQRYSSLALYFLLMVTCIIMILHFLHYEAPSVITYIYWLSVFMYILINGGERILDYSKNRDSKYSFESGLAKYKIKNYQSAIEDYNKAIKLQPEHVNSYFNRGLAKYHVGAIQDYTKVIQLNDFHAEAYRHRGLAKYALGDYEGAMQDATQAIALNPTLDRAYCDRGLAKNKLDNVHGAIEDFSKNIELKPSEVAYYNRGNTKLKLGDREAAIEDYTKAIELKPDFAAAYYGRGLVNYKLGNYTRAKEDYNKAIEMKPDYKEAIHALNNLSRVN